MSLAARTAARRAAVAPKLAFAAYAPRFYSSTTHGNDPETLETEKQRNLKGIQGETSTTIENAPGWNEYLASDSEADVKADRSELKLPELQQLTVEHVKKRHHATGSSSVDPSEQGSNTAAMSDGDVVDAVYEREEVTGPLKGAASGSEFVEEDIEVTHRVTRTR
ncbi:uncharacterized protein LAESUDRAFT_724733 [Laetiporus sulphureus 93-53]|uniref:Uncharacterized protein n=1 Tax=Laetiporus sulphureus 93-53 TaxID=1314785 RepID=A0A165ETP5_9APHY|nr:uncharacterized protein LAESUDRAFT_724733 [Laetiporus sulphureus 93-53]KZT07738.1 hypothetical protein LAESUDRAFT_724733 [Laetiporus sulphureus 93-53]